MVMREAQDLSPTLSFGQRRGSQTNAPEREENSVETSSCPRELRLTATIPSGPLSLSKERKFGEKVR